MNRGDRSKIDPTAPENPGIRVEIHGPVLTGEAAEVERLLFPDDVLDPGPSKSNH